MIDPNSQFGTTAAELDRNVLLAVVAIGRVKMSIAQDSHTEGMLHDFCFLVVIESGMQRISGVVVDDAAQVSLNFLSALSDGEFGPVFNISLDKHHPMRLTEALRGTLQALCILPHLFLSEPCLIQVPLQSAPLQAVRRYPAFVFQNENDLSDTSRRHFPLKLDCLG